MTTHVGFLCVIAQQADVPRDVGDRFKYAMFLAQFGVDAAAHEGTVNATDSITLKTKRDTFAPRIEVGWDGM